MSRMRTLLIQLPLTPPGPHAVYGQAWIDTAAPSRAQPQAVPLGLLPTPERRDEVAVMVPAAALSWHRVSLPPKLGRQPGRLLPALHGLLEEQLLQELAQVHIALPPQWQSQAAGQPLWVAVCDKGWLLQHLQALASAQLPVQRLVPELAPPAQGQVWHALGPSDNGWLWCCSAEHGVTGWPLTVANPLQLPGADNAVVLAEPGLAGWAQARCPQGVQLVETASHWPAALASGWDLAQFDLAARLRQGRLTRWRQRLEVLRRSPAWRPARWGLLAAVLVQLVGLNAWAWMARQQWQTQQEAWTRMVQESFPHVSVVVDAPVQMAREVARLRQGSGQLTASDLEALLQALGSALPAGVPSPSRLDYSNGVLQWPALPLSAAQKLAFEQTLAQQGYTLRTESDAWRLQAREGQR